MKSLPLNPWLIIRWAVVACAVPALLWSTLQQRQATRIAETKLRFATLQADKSYQEELSAEAEARRLRLVESELRLEVARLETTRAALTNDLKTAQIQASAWEKRANDAVTPLP